MMDTVVRLRKLDNGLTLEICDRTRRYFGDYFTIKLDLECLVPLDRSFFDDDASYEEAASRVKGPVAFRRTIERRGVPSASITAAREELLRNFEENALRYISSA